MKDFFNYLRALFEALFANIGQFFKTAFISPWANIRGNFQLYRDIFNVYVGGFGVWGWVLYIFYLLLWAALFIAIVYLIYCFIIKYIKYHDRKLDKTKLIEQVQKLNDQLYTAILEKNEILNLKVGSLGIQPGTPGAPKAKTDNDFSNSRFPKLAAVDYKYLTYKTHIEMPEIDAALTLEQLINKYRFFAASQMKLYYDLKTLRTFFAAMGTTKLIILEGISGTGKTSLPYSLVKFFQNDVKICSVQPSWRDRSELIGYYNEFAKKFNETEFLKAVYETTYREDNCLIVLDEMNLARIEYYFAEFLSIMEMPNVAEWTIEISNKPDPGDPKHLIDGKLLIPQNLWFIGTANNDDSTFTITDKVYDRAMTLTFSSKGVAFDCPFTEPVSITFDFLNKLFQEAQTNYPMTEVTLDKFKKLDTFIFNKFSLAFGNRIQKQMKIFVPNYVAAGGTEVEALDYIFASKILKKFVSLNIAFLHEELKELISEIEKLFGKGNFAQSKKIIEDFIKMS
ncbi:MAG: hypothetical protein NTV44_04960 [Firmicutes bacterium]|nr:hypothetical protein [Bacillota bacterium]